jgi:hypothetical protein
MEWGLLRHWLGMSLHKRSNETLTTSGLEPVCCGGIGGWIFVFFFRILQSPGWSHLAQTIPGQFRVTVFPSLDNSREPCAAVFSRFQPRVLPGPDDRRGSAGAPQAPALQDDHPENESSFPSPVPFPRDFEILDSEILRVGALGAAPCSAASSEQSRKTASLVSLWRPRFKRQTSGFRPSASLSDPAAQDRDRRFRQLVERIGGSVYRRFRRRTVRVGMSACPFTVPLIFVGAEGDAVDVA